MVDFFVVKKIHPELAILISKMIPNCLGVPRFGNAFVEAPACIHANAIAVGINNISTSIIYNEVFNDILVTIEREGSAIQHVSNANIFCYYEMKEVLKEKKIITLADIKFYTLNNITINHIDTSGLDLHYFMELQPWRYTRRSTMTNLREETIHEAEVSMRFFACDPSMTQQQVEYVWNRLGLYKRQQDVHALKIFKSNEKRTYFDSPVLDLQAPLYLVDSVMHESPYIPIEHYDVVLGKSDYPTTLLIKMQRFHFDNRKMLLVIFKKLLPILITRINSIPDGTVYDSSTNDQMRIHIIRSLLGYDYNRDRTQKYSVDINRHITAKVKNEIINDINILEQMLIALWDIDD